MAAFHFIVLVLFLQTHTYGKVTDATVNRHLRVLHVEIDMLTSILSKKESVKQQIEYCVTSLETQLNDTSELTLQREIGIPEVRSFINELKHLSLQEKDIYKRIVKKMKPIFPAKLLIRGSKQTPEMISELDNIFSRFTDIFADPVDEDLPQQCLKSECFGPITTLPRYMTSFNICDECEIRTFTLADDNTLLVPSWGQILLYSGKNGVLIKSFDIPFENPDGVAYDGNGTVYVDGTLDTDRVVYKYEMVTGEFSLILTIHRGHISYGLEFVDGMLFAGGKYGGGMYILMPGAAPVRIYSFINTYEQFYRLSMCSSEPGSKYGLLSGEMVGNGVVLVTSTGERLCSVKRKHQHLKCGAVRRNGSFYLSIRGVIIIYNNRCEHIGEFNVPGVRSRQDIHRLVIRDNTLYVHVELGHFVVFRI